MRTGASTSTVLWGGGEETGVNAETVHIQTQYSALLLSHWFFFMCECSAGMYVYHVHAMPTDAKRGRWTPGTKVSILSSHVDAGKALPPSALPPVPFYSSH